MPSNGLQTPAQVLACIPSFSGEWNIGVSFGKSRSSNLERAVFLARQAPVFFEGEDVYQATFSASPKEYLAFVKLYEMVEGWKSTLVTICGYPVDRKIIGGINYCYGDRCRSGNIDFCSGASFMTQNPFGCHRLQVSACNNPWWSFGTMDAAKVWHVDMLPILKRIANRAGAYHLCPAFSKEKVLEGVLSLPETINPKVDKEWEYSVSGHGVAPRRKAYECSITLNLDIDGAYPRNPTPPQRQRGSAPTTDSPGLIRLVLYAMVAIGAGYIFLK